MEVAEDISASGMMFAFLAGSDGGFCRPPRGVGNAERHCARAVRCVVLSCMHQKTWALALLAIVLAWMTIATVIACQMHDLPFAHDHAAAPGHHQRSAPGHTTGSVPCLLAVLPPETLFLMLTSVRLHTVPVVVLSSVPSLPPFVPPR